MLLKTPSRRDQFVLFARNFFKHPKMLGSLIPSSRFLIDMVLRRIDFSTAKVIIEYGPGVGTFTTEILKRLRPDGTLVVFEMNRDFVTLLRKSYVDHRLIVVHGSAADVRKELDRNGIKQADAVISGIPFSTMKPSVRDSILNATHAVLRPGGSFLVYQFSPEVLRHLRPRFARVEQDFQLLNVLPARLFHCVK